jgi:hypothetical protein
MTDARELRRALAAVARAMNDQVHDWQRLSVQEHVGLARLALDGGDLAQAATSVLWALFPQSPRVVQLVLTGNTFISCSFFCRLISEISNLKHTGSFPSRNCVSTI